MARRRIGVRWALTAALLTIHCAPVQRREERTDVGLGGMYGNAAFVQRGCDGDVRSEQHRQLGFEAIVHHEAESGLLLGGRAFATQDELVGSQGFDPVDPHTPYWLLGAGAWFGWDWSGVGLSGGFHVVHSEQTNAALAPFVRLKLGDTERIWLDGVLGPDDPLLFANVLSGAVGVRTERLRLRAGLSLGGRLLVSRAARDDRESEYESGFDPGLQLGTGDAAGGPFLDAEIDLPGRLGVNFGFFYGDDAPAGRFGLSYRW